MSLLLHNGCVKGYKKDFAYRPDNDAELPGQSLLAIEWNVLQPIYVVSGDGQIKKEAALLRQPLLSDTHAKNYSTTILVKLCASALEIRSMY